MKTRLAFAALFSATAISSIADTPIYSISAHIISNGSSVHSASNCYRLDAVIAEPIVGASKSDSFVLTAGFGYIAAPASDSIFANGFEDCSP